MLIAWSTLHLKQRILSDAVRSTILVAFSSSVCVFVLLISFIFEFLFYYYYNICFFVFFSVFDSLCVTYIIKESLPQGLFGFFLRAGCNCRSHYTCFLPSRKKPLIYCCILCIVFYSYKYIGYTLYSIHSGLTLFNSKI